MMSVCCIPGVSYPLMQAASPADTEPLSVISHVNEEQIKHIRYVSRCNGFIKVSLT